MGERRDGLRLRIADAIVFAAEHRRREIWLAWPSIKAILSEKIAPRAGDMVLAKTGFSSQQTTEPLRKGRPDNLFEPLAGDYGAHGEFDAVAKSYSTAWWLSKHRAVVIAGGVAVTVAAAGAVLGTPQFSAGAFRDEGNATHRWRSRVPRTSPANPAYSFSSGQDG